MNPYIVVIGTAQDGGLPQIGCECANCRRARSDHSFARMVSSLVVVDPTSNQRWLIDASPDLKQQVELLSDHPATRLRKEERPPLFDGVFLTHAHAGHYPGLLHFGQEIAASRNIPVYASKRMISFLRDNAPWDGLLAGGFIDPRPIEPNETVELAPGISVTPITVPHREDYTDTYAYVIRGPKRGVLYVPDIDTWEKMKPGIESVIKTVDIALLDGTFFSANEIPGRSIEDIPHPQMSDSIERFSALTKSERGKILFTHLNHSNPASDPQSKEAQQVNKMGMGIACEGEILPI
jgi:pyrroloquinoline quinone biosynthesis protein B